MTACLSPIMAGASRLNQRALLLAGLALFGAAGCTRSRPSPTPPASAIPLPDSPASVATPLPAIIQVSEPAEGANVTSPVQVSGTVALGPGRQLAAQVFSQGADGSRAWRGNGLLAVESDGSFAGTLAYTLAEPSPGVVEIAVVETASGAVYERLSINVNLAAAP